MVRLNRTIPYSMQPFFIQVETNGRLEKFHVFPSNLPEGMNYLVNIHGEDVRLQMEDDGKLHQVSNPGAIDLDKDLLNAIVEKIEDHRM